MSNYKKVGNMAYNVKVIEHTDYMFVYHDELNGKKNYLRK